MRPAESPGEKLLATKPVLVPREAIAAYSKKALCVEGYARLSFAGGYARLDFTPMSGMELFCFDHL